MKPITHAQKELLLEYFELLEKELSQALNEKERDIQAPAFADGLAARVHERVVRVAERVAGSAAPSLQQVRKTFAAVLDPAFFGEGAREADPLRALGVLRQQLRHQTVYTKPEWSPRGTGARKHASPERKRRKRSG